MYIIRDAQGRAVAQTRSKTAAHRYVRRANQAGGSVHNQAAAEPIGRRVVTPLYGHTDAASAYVVADYPYSFRLRTSIRYWLENVPKKGVRFVSQTINPKTGAWNAPKKSTFVRFAGAMYLDENGHVQWDGISEYTEADRVLAFVRQFPNAEMRDLRAFASGKVKLYEGLSSGKIVWTVNKEKQETSDADKARYAADGEKWRAVLGLLGE